MSKKTYQVACLGCRTNQYEAQAFRDQLEAMGYRQAKEGEAAEICIVNTCTVTAGADRDSRRVARQLVRKNPGARVVVTGCGAENQQQIFSEMEGVTEVILNKDKEQLLQKVYPEQVIPEFSIKNFDAHTRAFVKVQDGCNSFCTYCIIPYVRGRSRSRPMEEILREVRGLVEGGFREVVLTGVNVGDYEDGKMRLVDLVREVDQIEGVERLRISSIDPDEVDDELLGTVLQGRSTCHSMHIVLQSGSNVVLKRMNRKYTRQMFLETAKRLYRASPDFTMTTDVIVGFPGETERDFQETLDLVKEAKFAKVHLFPYSRRERTRAAHMPGQIAPEVMRERKAALLRAAEEAGFALRQGFLGRRMPVLTESQNSGHTENFLPVTIQGEEVEANRIVEVELAENSPSGFVGRISA